VYAIYAWSVSGIWPNSTPNAWLETTANAGVGDLTVRTEIVLYTSLMPHYSLRTYSFIFLIGRDPAVIPRWRVQMKGSLILISLVLAGAVFAVMPASGRQAAS